MCVHIHSAMVTIKTFLLMDQQELRLGNWVKPKHISGYYCVAELPSDDDFDPINITEANSEGFNLVKLKNIISLIQVVRSAPLVVPQEFYIVMELAGKAAIKIEYVHQLQNLYLDITGEYLDWNPEKLRSKLTIVK